MPGNLSFSAGFLSPIPGKLPLIAGTYSSLEKFSPTAAKLSLIARNLSLSYW